MQEPRGPAAEDHERRERTVSASGQRVAVVTGAGTGIGAATARLLAEKGLVVALVCLVYTSTSPRDTR
jgi:hypothetical protein